MSLDEKLFACWLGGFGLGQSVLAVRRVCNVDITAEDVRLAFVRCCERFA